ncbi:ACBP4 [Symbiodinium necroappetens]|uniref:ACBP4 protein n=1 Tax=Symbiodinium necroappetens TaxID=1628268 RepID=A0A812STV7_9DINO|nr:ACBP4 [Symbiodinium necroappetens]
MAAKAAASALRAAAGSRDVATLQQRLSEAEAAGICAKIINSQDPDTDLGALSLSAQHGAADCVAVLLAARADVNADSEDAGGRTALHFAAYDGHVEVVRLLVAARANTNVRCSTGETAEQIAEQRAKEWRIGGGDGEEAQTRCCRMWQL